MTGLVAHRRAMEVASQNIANANTEGYSRQRLDLQAIGGPEIPGLHAQAQAVGSGVTVNNVQRVRDAYLENRARADHAQGEYFNTKADLLDRVQQVFNEPSDTALQSQLGELWNSFGDLANRPNDPAARTAALQRGAIVADTIRGTSNTLGSLWDSNREAVDTTVSEINTAAQQVADLNKSIVASKALSQPDNELLDKRDLLIIKLAELSGARGTSRDDGSVDLSIDGSSLVYGSSARVLQMTGAAEIKDRLTLPVQLKWADNGAAASVSSGRVAAVLESITTTIPKYLTKVDDVASALAMAVNTQHQAGFDKAGNPGKEFYSGTTADTIQLALTSPDDLAAAGVAGPTVDGTNADKLAELSKDDTGPDRTYRQMVVDLGVEGQTVQRRAQIQASVVTDSDAARVGESGVSLDEEMTNMVAAERAFQAAAKVISTIDDMLDTIINRMGR
jgi:flagellar hook-associated protein 1 FlgK